MKVRGDSDTLLRASPEIASSLRLLAKTVLGVVIASPPQAGVAISWHVHKHSSGLLRRSLRSLLAKTIKGVLFSFQHFASLVSMTIVIFCHCESYRSRTWQSRCTSTNIPRDCFGLRPRNDSSGEIVF